MNWQTRRGMEAHHPDNHNKNWQVLDQPRQVLHNAMQTDEERQVIEKGRQTAMERANDGFNGLPPDYHSSPNSRSLRGSLRRTKSDDSFNNNNDNNRKNGEKQESIVNKVTQAVAQGADEARKAIYNATKTPEEEELMREANKTTSEKISEELGSPVRAKIDEDAADEPIDLEGEDGDIAHNIDFAAAQEDMKDAASQSLNKTKAMFEKAKQKFDEDVQQAKEELWQGLKEATEWTRSVTGTAESYSKEPMFITKTIRTIDEARNDLDEKLNQIFESNDIMEITNLAKAVFDDALVALDNKIGEIFQDEIDQQDKDTSTMGAVNVADETAVTTKKAIDKAQDTIVQAIEDAKQNISNFYSSGASMKETKRNISAAQSQVMHVASKALDEAKETIHKANDATHGDDINVDELFYMSNPAGNPDIEATTAIEPSKSMDDQYKRQNTKNAYGYQEVSQ